LYRWVLTALRVKFRREDLRDILERLLMVVDSLDEDEEKGEYEGKDVHKTPLRWY